ncbi:MAG: hypothetical protein J7599_05795 [Niabella sp.]|uniref:hypothetical protein n=1 Tax=Niabella sp. TaxID=1962976 RepID=UPI001B034947|nr:hypothetical protein [Niabella sp.]MBO9592405.1 hypothetical protein [Niabella sp.]
MTQRKPYNPNTKYGRRKLREQAHYNYVNGTPEYRKDIDNIKAIVWVVIIAIVIIIGFIIYSVSGVEGLLRWLK